MPKSRSQVGMFAGAVFDQLQSADVKYVVLRNYEGLPDCEGHDIDLLIAEGEVNGFEAALFRAAREQGWQLLLDQNRYGFRSYTFTSRCPGTLPPVLKWDIWHPIFWKGIAWVDSTLVLSSRRAYKGFWIPTLGAEAAILLLKEVLQFGVIRPKYLDRIWKFCDQDPEGFGGALAKHFGETRVSELLDQVRRRRWRKIETSYRALRLTLIRRALSSQPASTLRGWFMFLLMQLRDRLSGKGLFFLCFIGPDGTGKSTLSQRVSASLWKVFDGHTCYHHSRFGILPDLKTFLFWRGGEEETKSKGIPRPTESQAPGRLKGHLYLLYYGLDYLLGHLILLRARGRGGLLVFDRYFYDYVVQPSFFTIASPLFRALLALIPTPHAVIYLKVAPERVCARKSELSVEEIARQNGVCEQLVRRLPMAYVVNNNGSVDEVTTKVGEIVLEQMAQRVAYRGNLAIHGAR